MSLHGGKFFCVLRGGDKLLSGLAQDFGWCGVRRARSGFQLAGEVDRQAYGESGCHTDECVTTTRCLQAETFALATAAREKGF